MVHTILGLRIRWNGELNSTIKEKPPNILEHDALSNMCM